MGSPAQTGEGRRSPSASGRGRMARSAPNGHRKEGSGTRIEAATTAQEVTSSSKTAARQFLLQQHSCGDSKFVQRGAPARKGVGHFY